MKIEKIGGLSVIMSNPLSKHNYFAWPSAVRLKNGRIAAGASGYRFSHVCPFGKSVLSISEDEGETYTTPAPIIDTVLDDRDVGLCPFGESGLIFTSFNNTTDFQRIYAERHPETAAYRNHYLDLVTEEEQNAVLGATFRISFDNGVTFGPLYRSPVTSPHGPLELRDGTILWVGRRFNEEPDRIECHTLDPQNGTMTFVGAIENVGENILSCEPDTIELPDGTLLCHIRMQSKVGRRSHDLFTIYQSVSKDGGKTWSRPEPLLDPMDGSPPHLLALPDGTLICTYGRRILPYGIRVMVSTDHGKSWSTNHILYENEVSYDLGYPATVLLKDGSLITIFYAHPVEGDPAVILQQKWRIAK